MQLPTAKRILRPIVVDLAVCDIDAVDEGRNPQEDRMHVPNVPKSASVLKSKNNWGKEPKYDLYGTCDQPKDIINLSISILFPAREDKEVWYDK